MILSPCTLLTINSQILPIITCQIQQLCHKLLVPAITSILKVLPFLSSVAIVCEVLEPPEDGMINYSPPNSTVAGTVAMYECSLGVMLAPGPNSSVFNEDRTCLLSGEWSGIAPVCKGLVLICNGLAPFIQ